MSEKFNFTMNKLREVKALEKRTYFYDTKQPGLRLAASPSGNKSFQFQCWSKQLNKPVTRTLGKLGTISITEARMMAADLYAKVNTGVDIEETRRSQRNEPIFADMFQSYVETHAKVHKRTWKEDVRTYNNHFKKSLGNRRIDWISIDRIKQWHSKIGKENGHYIANRSLALLSTVFSHVLPQRINPCHGVKRFKEESRDRFLHPNELERFFKALEMEPNESIADFFMILLLTGSRKSNVCSMKWEEIDLEHKLWKIPAQKSKNAEALSVPLVSEVVAILEKRKKESDSHFVFPGTGRTGHMVDPKRGWVRIRKSADLADVRIHDLRRTMGSYMAGMGSSLHIIGKALGHKNQETTAIYSRLNIDPVRDAMSKASQVMLSNITGEEE
jgi:integrase